MKIQLESAIQSIILLIFLMSIGKCYSQMDIKRDTVNQLIKQSPAFTIFKDNYFISGVPLSEYPTKYNADLKFQISFKQRLINKPLPLGFFPYFAYTQKSFWNIYLNSTPFSESNYNPGFFFMKPMYKKGYLHNSFIFSIEHESNGKYENNYSRSWNYIAINYNHILLGNILASIKIWIPFELEDNPDLMKYIGYGEYSLTWTILEERLFSNVTFRKGTLWDWKGSYLLDIEYRPFKNGNQYVMLQWWNGYGESLIDYNKSTSMVRVGLIFRPSFYRFF